MTPSSKRLFVTRMDGPEDSGSTTRLNPGWTEIEAAIRRLDGKTCSLVVIAFGDSDAPHMAIGGGGSGKYLVYGTLDNMTFRNLINPAAPIGRCFLVAGGQRGEYAEKHCVGLSDALRAAKTYAETGQYDSALRWEEK
jgi:hypothetical protein